MNPQKKRTKKIVKSDRNTYFCIVLIGHFGILTTQKHEKREELEALLLVEKQI